MKPHTYTDVDTWTPVLHFPPAPNGESSLILGTFTAHPRALRAATLQLIAELHPELGRDADFDDIEDQLPDFTVQDLAYPVVPSINQEHDQVAQFLAYAQDSAWSAALDAYTQSGLARATGTSVELETFEIELDAALHAELAGQ